MNTSKIHQRVEQFSLETNWKPAERVLYNQGFKTHVIEQEGNKNNWVRTCVPGRRLRRKGGLHRWRFPTLESERFESHIGHPSPGVQHREDKPPWLVGGPLRLTGRLWEAWTPLVRTTQVLACSWGRGRGWIEDCSSDCPVSCDYAGACPSLSQANTPAHLRHLPALHWSEGCHNQGESSAMGHWRDSNPGQCLSGAGVASAGAYTGSAAGWSLSLTVENCHSPSSCVVWVHNRAMEAGGSD